MSHFKFYDLGRLSEAELEVFSCLLWADIDKLRFVYQKYGMDGLSLIALANIYLIRNGAVAGHVDDLMVTARTYCGSAGCRIADSLLRCRFFLVTDGGLFYSPVQAEMMRRMRGTDGGVVTCAERYGDGAGMLLPERWMMCREYMRRVFARIRVLVNRDLPVHVVDRMMMMRCGLCRREAVRFCRVMNFYVSMDHSFICFTDVLEVLARVLHRELFADAGMTFGSGTWVLDEGAGIVFDPVQRVYNGMQEIPSFVEICRVRERRFNIYCNLFSLKD